MNFLRKLGNKIKRALLYPNIIDTGAKIGRKTKVTGCQIGRNAVIGSHCRLKRVKISGNVVIGDHTSLWGPNLDFFAKINKIEVGKFCSIARNTTFQEYNHDFSNFTTYFIHKNLFKDGMHRKDIKSKGDIVIENDVWIGAHCVILSGAHIGNGAVVAANSVVTGSIPPYAIVAGSPAKVIKYRFSDKVIQKLLDSKWWDWDVQEIKTKQDYLNNILKETES